MLDRAARVAARVVSAWGTAPFGTSPFGGSSWGDLKRRDPLVVWFSDRKVGRLRTDDTGILSFTYEPQWVAQGTGFPLSIRLPLQTDEFVGGAAHAFFTNLLPEGDVRQSVCNRLGISSDNDFALLRAIGGDCAGAITILDAERSPSDSENERYEELDDQRLQQLLGGEAIVPLLVGGPAVRLSLAGAQDKIPVARLDGKLQLPYGGAPSTHIVKLPHRRYSHLPANEAFVTELARRIDLHVVSAELYDGTSPPSLLVERYDRRASDEKWPAIRLHQEDMCQAHGLPAARKYEQEGGPTLADVIRLVRDHVREPLVDVRRLIEWQAFNIVAGNSDGHGKNLSLLYELDGTVQLAPFYDLVSTRHYSGLDMNLAMSVGGRRNPDQIGPPQWEELAREVSVASRTIDGLVLGVAERCRDVMSECVAMFRSRPGTDSILQSLPVSIAKRAGRIERQMS